MVRKNFSCWKKDSGILGFEKVNSESDLSGPREILISKNKETIDVNSINESTTGLVIKKRGRIILKKRFRGNQGKSWKPAIRFAKEYMVGHNRC